MSKTGDPICFHSEGNWQMNAFGNRPGAKLLRFDFCCTPCEKVIFVSDENYIISAIRKFMLNMPSPGSFQDMGLKI